MNKRRLLKLAEFLETAELPGRFNMARWATECDDGKPACGSAACALGWATTIPSFRRAGLHLRADDDPSWPVPFYGHKSGCEAAGAFFGIDLGDALDLFDPIGDVPTGARGRRIVAKRIRKLVESAP